MCKHSKEALRDQGELSHCVECFFLESRTHWLFPFSLSSSFGISIERLSRSMYCDLRTAAAVPRASAFHIPKLAPHLRLQQQS